MIAHFYSFLKVNDAFVNKITLKKYMQIINNTKHL